MEVSPIEKNVINMGKIVFDKDELVHLGYSLEREILRTSRTGAFACTTLCFCNTRKYHGLLVAPQPQIDNEYHVLLSSFDETIIQYDVPFHLALHRYPNEIYSPKGHKYLINYEISKIAKHTFSVADIKLSKEVLLIHNQDRLVIKYKVEESDKPFNIQLNPFLAFRQRHKLSKANSLVNMDYDKVNNGAAFQLYPEYKPLFIQFSKDDVQYNHSPDWYYNFEYIKEAERGYECNEDLFMPGCFETTLKKGDILFVTASTQEMDAKEIKNLYSSELRVREEISSYEAELRRAAKMFFVEKDDKVEVIAGYPWFGRWGRDTFISLPGLCIGLNDMKLFKKAIDTLIGDMNQGLFPNIGSGEQIAYNSVDAPMWFFWAMQQYSDYTGKKKQIWKEYKEVMQSILCSYKDGTNHNIRMLDNCLIWAGEDGKALTWMDAVVDGVPVTQRKGMCVEINALWYNAIMFSLELAKDAKDKDFIRDWEEIAERIPTEFKATFWDKNYGWLADYVDGYYKDFTVRPNMVIATSLKYSCLSEKICQLILDRVEKELFTPFGLRTLSPTHKDYHDEYSGNQEQRDRAYHQGTVWTWLLGHFVEGYLKIYGDCALEIAERIYEGFRLHIKDYGVGGIAEIFDGNPPHNSKGSISQAWSVAEVVRIKYMIDKYKQEKEGEKV